MRSVPAVAGLFAGLSMLLAPAISTAGVYLSINIAPPVLRVYEQPPCPVDGYLWTPGYWAYGDSGYYWVDGAWLAPPQEGFLWTPGYWGYAGGIYSFNAGYWGPTVGFYGGVNYGFGYGGRGFDGGRWQGSHFAYNTAVSRVNTSVIHNTYTQNVSYGNNRTSFNGGPGGISARPTYQQASLARQHQSQPRAQQSGAGEFGAGRPAAQNAGRSANVAMARPQASRAPMNRAAPQPQNRMASQAAAVRPEANRPASTRPEPQQRQQQARSSVPNRPAPQQRQESRQAPQQRAPQQRAAAPERAAPQQRAAAPQRAAAGRPQGRDERK